MSHDPFVFSLGEVNAAAPFVISCEHAGHAVPPQIPVAAEDARWLQTHWGHDIGALALAGEIAVRCATAAVCAGFSRLLCDPNRPWDAKDCIRREVEGQPLGFNAALDDAALSWRRRELHERYHALLAATLAARRAQRTPFWLLSVHTLAPVLNGQIRAQETSLLFDVHGPLAHELRGRLREAGFSVALNEPYSGLQEGLIHSVSLHGRAAGVPYLELEVRQDLLGAPAQVVDVARRLVAALATISVRG